MNGASTSTRTAPARHARPAVLVAAAALLVVGLLAVMLPRVLRAGSAPAYDPESPAVRSFEDRTGVRLIHVALTGDGGVVELRYQILDPTKAAEALSTKTMLLVDEASGRRLVNPFMGHASHPVLKAGRTSFVLLLNSPATAIVANHEQGVGGHVLRSGGTVTVVIGDGRLEHVPVQ